MIKTTTYHSKNSPLNAVSFFIFLIFITSIAYLYINGRGDEMTEYSDKQELYDEYEELPIEEEPIQEKKIVIGKQLLIIIQLIICGTALLFMLVIKLIGGDFCNGIINWYEKNYYDSIYMSGENNNLSIFGTSNNSSESSK